MLYDQNVRICCAGEKKRFGIGPVCSVRNMGEMEPRVFFLIRDGRSESAVQMVYILGLSQMFLMETFPGGVLMKTYYKFLQCHGYLHNSDRPVKAAC